MRSINNAEEQIEVWPRVKIFYDDDTSVNLTSLDPPRLSSMSWGTNIDEDDWHCSMQFRNNEKFVEDNKSLDPLDELSELNKNSSGNYDPLLSNNHKVEVEISKDKGTNYSMVFEGLAGEGVDTSHLVSDGDSVDFQPYGLSQPLKEDQRITLRTYEDRDLATNLLRSVLLDSGFDTGRLSHIVVVDDPNKQDHKYKANREKVWKLLQNTIQKTGYKLAFRYHDSGTPYNDGSGESTPADGFYLTLYDPKRDKTTPDYTYGHSFTARKIDYSLDDVRTWVKVCYQDRYSGQQKCITPLTDEEARASYGIPIIDSDKDKKHRKMVLTEKDDSLVDTEEEAIDLANFYLHDTSSPTPDSSVQIDQMLWPNPQPHDLIKFEGNDYTINLGVTSVEHSWSIDNMSGSTTIKGSVDKVIGTHTYWTSKELTEEEKNEQRNKYTKGAIERLPDATLLDLTSHPSQSEDGTTVSAISVTWKRIDAWWYGHTKVWIKDITDKEGWDLRKEVRDGNHTVVKPVEPGHDYKVKIKHFPDANITPQGDR